MSFAEEARNSLESLKQQIQTAPDISTCKQLMSLMKSTVVQADSQEQSSKVVDGTKFNQTLKLCLVELVPALYKVLKLNNDVEPHLVDPSKSKAWKKVLTAVKSYLIDVLKILNYFSEPSSLKLVLKHIVRLVPFYIHFIKLARVLLKKMILIWSTMEETVRVVALLVIIRIQRQLPLEYHAQTLKQMYFAYVKNTKFTSPTTYPLVNFMKHSLVEVYALDPEIAYEHCFLYVRQLCIHLRNAVTLKKKESYMTVYNWQFVHCVKFWADLLSSMNENNSLKTLIYPLVQTIIGTINLIPTLKYVPLRFHLCQVLMQLSGTTGVYIPVASIILGALDLTDFNKKSTFAKKPMNFTCVLKASKAQLQESAFKDGIIAEVCNLLFEYYKLYAHKIAFPELALPTIVHIKNFLKKNKVAKYGQMTKEVLEKLQQNSDFISQRRKNVSFRISDSGEIKHWEEGLKSQDLPLIKAKRKLNEICEPDADSINFVNKKRKH